MRVAAFLSSVYEMNSTEGQFHTYLILYLLNNSLPYPRSACYVLVWICWACIYVHHFLAGNQNIVMPVLLGFTMSDSAPAFESTWYRPINDAHIVNWKYHVNRLIKKYNIFALVGCICKIPRVLRNTWYAKLLYKSVANWKLVGLVMWKYLIYLMYVAYLFSL